MGLTKYKLGELIEHCDDRNASGVYSLEDVKGISIKKEFIETKADMAGVSLTPYILVRPDSFAYVTVTSRNGEKITLAHNASKNTYIVSSSYEVFRVSRTDLLLSDYLFMFFNRPEFDRYSRFNSWGSARETFSWEDFRDIDITLPSIEQQRKYVDVYLALQKNLEAYQSKVDDLKLVCDGYIEDLRRKMKSERIGKYIMPVDERNIGSKITNVKGLTVFKQFIKTKADMSGVPLNNYKIVHVGEIAYVSTTNRNGDRVACGLCDEECIVSSIYEVVCCNTKLLPDYLFMWFKRAEFDRWGRYNSWGSARENFMYNDLADYKIPIPDISVQKEIVNIHRCYIERQRIAAQLKEQLNKLCPILIKGSLQK